MLWTRLPILAVAAALLAAGCGGSGASSTLLDRTPASTCGRVALTSPTITASNNDDVIRVYDLSGKALAALGGPHTQIGFPFGVAYGPDGNLWVASNDPPAVLAFPAGANGDCAPARVLSGAATGLGTTYPIGATAPLNAGIAFDTAGNLYVAGTHDADILVFAPGASGNTPPIRTIAGSATRLSGPRQISFDAFGRLWVANRPANLVSVYAAGASGNAAPVLTLEGPHTQINSPWGVALDSAGYIWITNAEPDNRILVFDDTATGDAIPKAIITGPPGVLNNPYGEAFDANGDLWIADQKHSTLDKFSQSASGSAAPLLEFRSGLQPNFVTIR